MKNLSSFTFFLWGGQVALLYLAWGSLSCLRVRFGSFIFEKFLLSFKIFFSLSSASGTLTAHTLDCLKVSPSSWIHYSFLTYPLLSYSLCFSLGNFYRPIFKFTDFLFWSAPLNLLLSLLKAFCISITFISKKKIFLVIYFSFIICFSATAPHCLHVFHLSTN